MEPEGSLPRSQKPTTGPADIFTSYFCKTHSNVILPAKYVSRKWPYPFWFTDQLFYEFLMSYAYHKARVHSIWDVWASCRTQDVQHTKNSLHTYTTDWKLCV